MKWILYCFGKHRSLDQSLEWVEGVVVVIQEAFLPQAKNVNRTFQVWKLLNTKSETSQCLIFFPTFPSDPALALLPTSPLLVGKAKMVIVNLWIMLCLSGLTPDSLEMSSQMWLMTVSAHFPSKLSSVHAFLLISSLVFYPTRLSGSTSLFFPSDLLTLFLEQPKDTGYLVLSKSNGICAVQTWVS